MPGVQSPLAFGFLIERLRLHGFTAGTADCLRLQDLLSEWPAIAHRATSKRCCARFSREAASNSASSMRYSTSFGARRNSEGPLNWQPPVYPRRSNRRRNPSTAAPDSAPVGENPGSGAYAGARAGGIGHVPAAGKAARPHHSTGYRRTSATRPPAPPETTRVTHEGIVTRSRFAGPLRTAAALGVIAPLVWLACFLWIRRTDRKEAEAVVRHYKPPYRWDVRPKATPLECYRTEKFYTAARKLRLRLASGRQVLDLPATILATVKQRGYPDPRYRTVTRPADYLCLIHRNSPEDHRAGLFDALVAGLATEDVAVHRYFFETDARVCTNMAGDRTWSLVELMRKYPVSAVLVFGDTADMFHPVRGDLLAWAEPDESGPRARLFTCGRPTPRQARMAAKAETGIFPADVDGLLAFAELMSTGGKPTVEYTRTARYAAANPIPETPAELRAFLGRDAYALLCACAAYPKLDWNLTLYLGAALPGGRKSLTERALTRLVQLPWFQSGGLPERLRAVLVRDLEPAQTSAVQRALAGLLERDKPPEGNLCRGGTGVATSRIQGSRCKRRGSSPADAGNLAADALRRSRS